jgi:ATP-binding cassette subfamily B protein
MDKIARGRTVIATILDMRFIEDFDWIVVLDQGKVAGLGRHDKLLTDCPPYAKLWELEKKIGQL